MIVANFMYKYCKLNFLSIERCQSIKMLNFNKVLRLNEFHVIWHVFDNRHVMTFFLAALCYVYLG